MSVICTLFSFFIPLFGHPGACVTVAAPPVTMEIYTHNEYSIEYPSTYVVDDTSTEDVVLVEGPYGRLEIFRTDDFLPERLHGFSSSGLDPFEAALVPKEESTHRDYSFWSFYEEGDMPTKEELDMIIDSFTQ